MTKVSDFLGLSKKNSQNNALPQANIPISNIIADTFSTIPLSIGQGSLRFYEHNNFVHYLKTLFQDDLTAYLIQKFRIGTSKHWQGANVFWQIDHLGNIRTGKIMLYDPNTGKRVKHPFNCVNWVHAVLSLPNYNLQQCLFGEHQLLEETNAKTIAIVESEKTAVLMSALMPQCIWLATGGLSNLSANKCKVLAKRDVVLYPDLGAFEKWQAKEADLKSIGCKVITSDLLEKYATPNDKQQGYDIADYFIKQCPKTGLALTDTEGSPVFWDFNNHSSIFKNSDKWNIQL